MTSVRSDEDALAEIGELRRCGVAENNAGRPMRALALFKRAQRMLDAVAVDSTTGRQRAVLAARLVLSRAMSASELNGLEAGLAALSPVENYLSSADDPEVAVHLHLQRGYMTVRGGYFNDGLAELNAAVDLLEFAEPAARCNILINRGMVQLYLGDHRQARLDYLRAAEVADEYELRVEQAKATHNLGELEFYAGNLANALTLMNEATRLQAEVSFAVALVDRAKVLLEAGLHREADETLQEAGALFRKDRLFKDVGEVELARAECALLDGQIAAARRLASRARDRFRRRGNDSWRRNAELVLLQADLAAGRPGARIAPPARRLAAEFVGIGLLPQARLARLIEAEALLSANNLTAAEQIVRGLGTRATDSISVRLHSRFLQADLARQTGDKTTARSQVRRGLAELSTYQARFGSIDLQTGSAIHGRRLAELDLDLAISTGRPGAVLDAVERGRASSSRLVPVRPPDDDEIAALLGELRRSVDALRGAENESSNVSQSSETRRRIAEIQRQLRSYSWRADGSGAARRPAKASEVRAELNHLGAALACFVQVGDALSAIVEGAGSARIHRVGSAAEVSEHIRRLRADLDVLANGLLPDALFAAVRQSLTRTLTAVDDALIRPLRLPDGPLVIVPTGPLATLPWNELPSLRGRSVSVAPSATAWLTARAMPTNDGPLTVAAFAGPDLNRAVGEIKTIAELWGPAMVRAEENARPDQLVSAIAQTTIVHVAAHGQHQPENPLFSSIRLADGPLFAYELDQNARAAEHVVLSACELGQATIRPGDEALGLTSVLLHLGTRSVISGVCRVHDEVAADLMTRYHRALSTGADSAQALADACAASDRMPAPFVCFGSTWQASSPRPSAGID
ncbi:MAG TPA: CHAT domain-containing tetratricopeptide repeat protein [Jatrophihabitans sp.]